MAVRNMLKIIPQVAMYDSPVSITVAQLRPKQKITISASVNYSNTDFESRAFYTADDDGSLDCRNHGAHSGSSFEGVHPMGLFWSLQPSPSQRPGARLLPRDVSQPITYRFQLYDGHVTDQTKRSLAETVVERHLLHPDVMKTDVEVGRLRGALFMPKNTNGPVPAIIDLFGTAGGLVQHRSALLASHGFATLSLAYFAFKDLPKTLNPPLELDYFEEAAEWLSEQPNIISDKIGMVGVSLGADIAALSGIFLSKIKAAVSINAFHMVDPLNPLSYKGIPFELCKSDMSMIEVNDGVINYGSVRNNIETIEELIYPVQKAPDNTQFLFFPCADDQNTPSVKCARILKERFEKCGKGSQCEVIEFDGAGHLLEPPYTPHCPYSYHRIADCLIKWGGEKHKHAAAQDKAWKILKDFFAKNLGQPAPMKPFNIDHKSAL